MSFRKQKYDTVATYKNSISHGKYSLPRTVFRKQKHGPVISILFSKLNARIEDSCLLTLALVYICFVLYIASMIWQDYEFIFEPSTGVRHPKFQYFSYSFDKGDGNFYQTKRRAETIGKKRRERERKRFTDVSRAWTQRPGEYISAFGGTISSIKYTPPSLDKLKRRMTVLRRRLSVMRAEARKEFRGHMTLSLSRIK